MLTNKLLGDRCGHNLYVEVALQCLGIFQNIKLYVIGIRILLHRLTVMSPLTYLVRWASHVENT